MNPDPNHWKGSFTPRPLHGAVAVLAGIGLFLAACGGNGAPGVANVGSPTPSPNAFSSGSGVSGALAYSACMRSEMTR
jgi:hypothetical protein